MRPTAADRAAPLRVAVAVIINERSEVLLTRRHAERHQGGLWEFPGGKCEPGEALGDALRRELHEELAITVESHEPLIVIEHDYGDRRVRLDVQRVLSFAGTPAPCEAQPMRWVPLARLPEYAFPAANAPIVERLLRDALQASAQD